MKFLLVYHPAIQRSRRVAEKVAEQLHIMEQKDTLIWNVEELEQIDQTAFDMVLTFGGDGTIIHTASHFLESQTPLLGINLGTVGFLSNLEVEEIETFLPALIAGDYELEERTVLEAEICEGDNQRGPYYCINELCIKSPKAHMMDFQVVIGGELHSRFRGDGMLVSTPTGSTAYALSAGGPVIDPELEVLLLTPLVSYLLSKKPLVLAGRHEVCLYGEREQEALISIDGRITRTLEHPFQIRLRQAQNRMLLVNLRKRNFFASVEKRLGQNAAP